MTIRNNTFEGCTVGATITSSNQQGAGSSGDTLTVVRNATATNVCTATAGEIIGGAKSAKLTGVAAGDTTYFYWDDATTMSGTGLRIRFTLSGAPSADTQVAAIRRASSATGVTVVLKTTGKLELWDVGGFVYATPSALTLPATITVDLAVEKGTGTGDGKASFAVYDSNGDLTGGMSSAYSSTARNTGTTNYVRALAGIIATTGTCPYVIVDDLTWTDTYGLQGPVGATDARPSAVIAAGNWTAQGGAADIAAATADSSATTYAQSGDNPSGDVARFRLQSIASGSVSISFTYWVTSASPSRSFTASLYTNSGTLISTSPTVTGITSTSPINFSWSLSAGENAAFTNRTSPELRISAS